MSDDKIEAMLTVIVDFCEGSDHTTLDKNEYFRGAVEATCDIVGIFYGYPCDAKEFVWKDLILAVAANNNRQENLKRNRVRTAARKLREAIAEEFA